MIVGVACASILPYASTSMDQDQGDVGQPGDPHERGGGWPLQVADRQIERIRFDPRGKRVEPGAKGLIRDGGPPPGATRGPRESKHVA